MREDEWLKAARVEDAVVAELLLSLKEVKPIAPPPPTMSTSTTQPKQALFFKWRVRQRRSKAVMMHPKNQTPRASPTTPLSYSGGAATSFSGGIDCGPEEECCAISLPESEPKSSDITRSKVVRSNEPNTIRRSRKKKTLADLKAEEELLARERRQLQKELESVRDNLEKERARNENFKRIKLQQMASVHLAPVTLLPILAGDVIRMQHSSVNACSQQSKEDTVRKSVLPDLNLPFEENFCSLC